MIDGLLILLFFQFLGEVVIRLTGIPLPAEDVGILPSRDWKMGRWARAGTPGKR